MRRRKRSSGTYKIVFCYDIIYYSAACSLVPILTDCHYTLYRAHTALGTVTYPPPPPPSDPSFCKSIKRLRHTLLPLLLLLFHTHKRLVCVCVCVPFFSLFDDSPEGRKKKREHWKYWRINPDDCQPPDKHTRRNIHINIAYMQCSRLVSVDRYLKEKKGQQSLLQPAGQLIFLGFWGDRSKGTRQSGLKWAGPSPFHYLLPGALMSEQT